MMTAANITESVIGRYLGKIAWRSNGCLEWTAGLCDSGYGTLHLGKSKIRAHRLSWIIANGDIPDGLCVLHKCDNRKCVNPEHLFLGTNADNVLDRQLKGRAADRHGTRNPNSKLSDGEVREIRSLLRSGEHRHSDIADIFGVSRSQVSKINIGLAWGDTA